jgi:membrane protein YdbS with pleckstrin-like domain
VEGTAQERRSGDRRGGDRRAAGGRREEDRRARQRNNAIAVAWALVGAVVVLYLFLLVVDAVDPDRAPAASIVVLVLAVVWIAHAWRRLYAGGYVSRPDRERRGF